MFFLSATGISSLRTAPAFLYTGVDSPVSGASFACRFHASTSRASAGTRSPTLRTMRSPGTSSLEGISKSLPSRMTRALGAARRFKASSAFSPRYSSEKPMIAQANTIAMITSASTISPITKEIAVATKSMTIKISINCERSILHHEIPFTFLNSLGPNSASRLLASSSLKPFRSVFKMLMTSFADKECQRTSMVGFAILHRISLFDRLL